MRFHENMILEKNSDLAELIGIILGDGNLYYNETQHKYFLRISSNTDEEVEYRRYTFNLMEKLFGISPRIVDKRDRKGTDLIIQNREIIDQLIITGLKTGNKVKNQVYVPFWILEKEEYIIVCLRGLFDTDGSIYVRNTQKTFGLNFKNGSLLLVKNFKEMCESLSIKTQKIPKPKSYKNPDTEEIFYAYQITIENKSDISKFLNIIKPEKWINHLSTLGMILLSFQFPDKRDIIKRELDKKYPDKKIHYNKEYSDLLRDLMIERGITINPNTLTEAIKIALSDKRKAIQLNHHGVQLIKQLPNILRKNY